MTKLADMQHDYMRPNAEAITAIEQSTKRQHFTDVRHVTVRWEPYKPDGQRQMKAFGRWQEQTGDMSSDYWSWKNCDRPAFAYDPQDNAAMTDRIEELEAKLARALKGLSQCEAKIDAHIRREYPGPDPVFEGYRQWGFASNPARITLAALKGQDDE